MQVNIFPIIPCFVAPDILTYGELNQRPFFISRATTARACFPSADPITSLCSNAEPSCVYSKGRKPICSEWSLFSVSSIQVSIARNIRSIALKRLDVRDIGPRNLASRGLFSGLGRGITIDSSQSSGSSSSPHIRLCHWAWYSFIFSKGISRAVMDILSGLGAVSFLLSTEQLVVLLC